MARTDPAGHSAAARRWAWAAATLAVALFCVDLRWQPGGEHVTRAIDDIAQFAAALAGAVGCAVRAGRSTGRSRVSWWLLAGGCAGWAAGEAIWTYYEVLANRQVPFPSAADAGYLSFPVLALAGLLVRPSSKFSGVGRLRVTLDALLLTASLFTLSWLTALGRVFHAGASSRFALVISLAYPVSDLLMIAVVLLTLSHSVGRAKSGLLLVAAGLGSLAVADSGFAYLTTIGAYHTGNLIDTGWVGGFLLLALAAAHDVPAERGPGTQSVRRWALWLPYPPAAVAVFAGLYSVHGGHQDDVAIVGAVFIFLAVLGRQLVVLQDNRRLLGTVLANREQLRHQVFTDQLTGLANRTLFQDRLEHALELHRRDLRPVSLLLMDLDEFKLVNDSLGHPTGDELLVRIGERLRATTRTGDTVARIGGDEFAIVIEDDGDAIMLAGRLHAALERPVRVDGRSLPVAASIGVVALAADAPALPAEEMLKRADVAMYAAKHRGKAQTVVYTADLEGTELGELDLRIQLAQDVAARRIAVAYQPVYALSGELLGFEALARWSRDGVPVPPARFLPIAQRGGLLSMIDEHVLETALRRCAGWPSRPALCMSVNAGVDHLSDARLPERVARLLAELQLSPQQLVVEIPETSPLGETVVANLGRLRELGIRLALDDFGTGYSALARLQEIPPDIIKIDRAFIAPLADPGADVALLAGMVDLAHRVGAFVVAEGVEQPAQLDRLSAVGCDGAQGFLLGRPQAETDGVPAMWQMPVSPRFG